MKWLLIIVSIFLLLKTFGNVKNHLKKFYFHNVQLLIDSIGHCIADSHRVNHRFDVDWLLDTAHVVEHVVNLHENHFYRLKKPEINKM